MLVEPTPIHEVLKLKDLLKIISEKCNKTKKTYKAAIKFVLRATTRPPTSQVESVGKLKNLQVEIKDLKKKNANCSAQLNQIERQGTQITKASGPLTSSSPKKKVRLDLHCDKEGDLDTMSNDKHPIPRDEWHFQNEFFKELCTLQGH